MTPNHNEVAPVKLSPGKEFFTERELATRWAISVKTLQQWRLAGKGVAYSKIGSRVRYAAVDIVAFEVDARRSSTSHSGSTSN